MFKPRDVKTLGDARRIVEERGLSHVKVGLFDNDVVMRGKYMSRSKFFSALEHGFAFCDVVLGWDVKDQLYDNARYTGWHTGYPDAPVRILPHTCREIPFENGMLLFLAEFDQQAEAVCPRGTLRRVVERCQGRGKGVETPLGIMPGYEDLDWTGLDKLSAAQFAELTKIDTRSWKEELALHDEFFAKLGKSLPAALEARRGGMHERLAA